MPPRLCRARAPVLALALALLAMLAAAPARPAHAADTAAIKKAKAFYDRAEAHYRLRDFDKALADYRAAYKLARRPNLLFNIAQCYKQLKKHEKAIFYYKLYLSDWARQRPGVAVPYRAELNARIAKLQRELDAINKAAKGSARGASGKGTTGSTGASTKGAKSASAKPPALGGARRGQLVIAGLRREGARILVDGVLRGVTPLVQHVELDAGPHQLRVEAKGYVAWTHEVTVKPGQKTRVWVDLRQPRGRNKLWLIGSLTGALLAGGAEAMALVYRAKANEHFRGTAPYDEDKRLVTIGHVLAGVFGALAVTTFVLYFTTGGNERAVSASLGLAPRADGAAAVGRITF